MSDPASPPPAGTPIRRFVRRPVAAQLRCQALHGPGHLFFDTQDLSIGGAFLRSDLLLEEGEELEVTFTLPGSDRQLQTRARVAWVRRGEAAGAAGMGLEFVALTPEDREALSAFLEDA
ncbi:MAG: PilZ domain-containing protein [Deltaproteobacteria bacterium]